MGASESAVQEFVEKNYTITARTVCCHVCVTREARIANQPEVSYLVARSSEHAASVV